jgi:hypothetical protein
MPPNLLELRSHACFALLRDEATKLPDNVSDKAWLLVWGRAAHDKICKALGHFGGEVRPSSDACVDSPANSFLRRHSQ